MMTEISFCYRLGLSSKMLTSYVDFLKRMKLLGDDFLVKEDMWIPCIKTENNSPGIHIGKDPMYDIQGWDKQGNVIGIRRNYRCSNLSDTIKSICSVKGRKTDIILEYTDNELSLYINDTQWVIASKRTSDTVDMCPEYNTFQDILSKDSEWYEIEKSTLEAIQVGHPVTIIGKITGCDETTPIRLARSLLPLTGVVRSVEYTGEYTLVQSTKFDSTVADLCVHMVYPKIECAHIYYIRKY